MGGEGGGLSGLQVMITGPTGNLELQREDAVGEKFAFTATTSGVHRVCLTSSSDSPRRVVFDWVAGAEATIDYSALAKTEQLKPLELEMRKLVRVCGGGWRDGA